MDALSNQQWKSTLAAPQSTAFSGYVDIRENKQNTIIDYVNDSPYQESAHAVLLQENGIQAPHSNIKEFMLSPGAGMRLDVGEWAKESEYSHFRGSVLMLQKFDPVREETRVDRILMANWRSRDYRTEIGTEVFGQLNIKGKKEKQSFFMFCPVVSTDAYKTIAVLFNYSTDPEYHDVVTLTPRLNDAKGVSIIGKPFTIEPFGTGVLDVEEHFGRDALKNGEYYTLSISHVGHIFSSFFFHVSRDLGLIITGRHTQPATSIFRPVQEDIIKNILREYRKIIPF